MAKLAAGRPKDMEFVPALVLSGHLDPEKIKTCAAELTAGEFPGARGDVLRRLKLLVP